MKNSWLVRNSFMFMSFVIPIIVILGVFLSLIPQEALSEKPPFHIALLGLLAAMAGWVLLVPIFGLFWIVCMRQIYGKDSVAAYLKDGARMLPEPIRTWESKFQKIYLMLLK